MKKLFPLVSLAMLLFSACTTLRSISYERLHAAEVCFPEEVHKVGIINHMPSFEEDPASIAYSSGLLEGDGKVMTEAFAQAIASTNYFEQVVICDSALRSADAPLDWESSLAVGMVDSLIQALEVDMLFVTERVGIQLKESSLYVPEQMTELPAMDGVITPVVRAYVTTRTTPLFEVSCTDTVCWEITPTLTYGKLIKDASEYAATLPMKQLIPHWEEIYRGYFDGGRVEMRDAGVYVREQNWEEAARIWQKLYDNQKKGKVRMRAAYNLAVYHELQNEFERALEYLDEADRCVKAGSWEEVLFKVYRIQLTEGARQNRMLKIQMKRFE